MRSNANLARGSAPSVLCNVAGYRALQWLPYAKVFSDSMLSKTAKNAKYLACGAPPKYLRQPGVYGLPNFTEASYWQIEQYCSFNLGFSNFNKGKKKKGKAVKKRRLQYGDDELTFQMEPTVVAIDNGRLRKACEAVVKFTKFHKNPNELEGGLRVKGIINFKNQKSNLIQGFGTYQNVRLHAICVYDPVCLCPSVLIHQCCMEQVVRRATEKAQRAKTIVWGVRNDSTNTLRGNTPSFADFVDALDEFKITGAASWRQLWEFAYNVASSHSGLEMHKEPLVVHFLEQVEELEFKAHIDTNEGESDTRVRVSVIVKLEDGLAHGVGFWPCGCGADDCCSVCEGDTQYATPYYCHQCYCC